MLCYLFPERLLWVRWCLVAILATMKPLIFKSLLLLEPIWVSRWFTEPCWQISIFYWHVLLQERCWLL